MLLTESEDNPLPVCPISAKSGMQTWDVDLCDWGDGAGPEIGMRIPIYFMMRGADNAPVEYSGSGVIGGPIQDLLEQYLSEFREIDGGVGVPAFVAWLRDYADRLEKAHQSG